MAQYATGSMSKEQNANNSDRAVGQIKGVVLTLIAGPVIGAINSVHPGSAGVFCGELAAKIPDALATTSYASALVRTKLSRRG